MAPFDSLVKSRRRAEYGLEGLEQRTLLSAQLVSDINTAPGSSEPSNPVQANGLTFFVADDGLHGREVWQTDGTAAGTFLVKDVARGPATSYPKLLGAAGGTVYFQTWYGLWATQDGVNVRQIPGGAGAGSANVSASVGDNLYFGSTSLCRVSGDTVMVVKEVGRITQMTAVGSTVYIVTSDNRLWASDGTAAGTVVLKALGVSTFYKLEMMELGGTLYFTALNAQTSAGELWKTQGTAATTSLVASYSSSMPVALSVVGQRLLYIAFNGLDETLWSFDPVSGQATSLQVIRGQQIGSVPAHAVSGSKLYFSDFTFNSNLWVTDGTVDGTFVVKSRYAGSLFRVLPNLIDLGGTLLFEDVNASRGSKLWRTDGTVANTVFVADIGTATNPGGLGFLGLAGGKAVFSKLDVDHGMEPWVTDGTTQGTGLLRDLYTGTAGSNAEALIHLNGRLLVAANASLWSIDDLKSGVAEPVTFGIDGAAVGLWASPYSLVRSGNLVYFAGYDFYGACYLSVTDGTSAGTRAVKKLPGGVTSMSLVEGHLYFVVGQVLYTSDGTDAGTVALMTVPSNYSVDAPRQGLDGESYFFDYQQYAGAPVELRKTDGTVAGTSVVSTFTTGNSSSSWLSNRSCFAVGSLIYFLDGNGNLNQTDGITTVRVPGVGGQYSTLEALGGDLLLVGNDGSLMRYHPGNAAPETLANVSSNQRSPMIHLGKWVYFSVDFYGPKYGSKVWRTDGTVAGTSVVVQAVRPESPTAVGDRIYYIDTVPGYGRELWATTGTAEGTYLVADLAPGDGSPVITSLKDVDGVAYFGANDGVHGSELFRAVDDVAPKVVSSTFDYAGHPVGVKVAFSERVVGLSAADWTLADRATGRDVSSWIASYAFDTDLDVARVTFAAGLPDGDYRLGLAAGAAADGAGNRSGEGLAFDFFQLAGDVNRDRAVDFKDLVIVAQNYNATGKTWGTGDVTGDGAVDFNDLVVLAQRYNTGLGAVPVAPGPVGAVSVGAEPGASVVKAEGKGRKVFSETPVVGRKVARRPVARRGR